MVDGILLGFLLYPILKGYRSLRAKGWDKSNITNFIRTESYTTMYPENLAKMYFLSEEQVDALYAVDMKPERGFPYLALDEFSDIFPGTRPDKK